MSVRRLSSPSREVALKHVALALMMVALASALVIEVLHGHACTGDGCVLCLVATGAHALLAVSLGAALACPIMRVASLACMAHGTLLPKFVDSVPAPIDARLERIEMTPVTLGVRLLI